MKDNKLMISKFNSSISEWQDSIYKYNKKNLNFFVYNNNTIISSLLHNYFNLNSSKKNNQKNIIFFDNKNYYKINNYFLKAYYYNLNKLLNTINIKKEYEYKAIEKNYVYTNKRKNALLTWKNELILDRNNVLINKKTNSILSLNKIFLGLPSIKHSNNSLLICIQIFNKNKAYFKSKLSKLKYLMKINKENKEFLKSLKFEFFKEKYHNNILLRKQSYNKFFLYNIITIKNLLYNIILGKSLNSFFKRAYLANIYLNNNKFNYLNMINIKNIISNIYQKKVNFNITNIKYAYLENSIFVNNLTRKLNDRKKGILKILKKAFKLIKIADMDPIILLRKNDKKQFRNNELSINKYINYINEYIHNKYKTIFNSIRNIHVIGISLEAKGRLTKRMTASRSVYKLKYKGNLKNMYSVYYKTSTPLLRGLLKSNINLIKNSSKNKNGSYGISSSFNTF